MRLAEQGGEGHRKYLPAEIVADVKRRREVPPGTVKRKYNIDGEFRAQLLANLAEPASLNTMTVCK